MELLQEASVDRAWAAQVGPALSQGDVARLLGKSEQAVSKDRALLRVKLRSGRIAYPLFQFEGRAVVAGLAQVAQELRDVLEPLTVCSWLTARNRHLQGRRPIDALRAGDVDDVDDVVRLARRFGRSMA